jgi:hypothetical protein
MSDALTDALLQLVPMGVGGAVAKFKGLLQPLPGIVKAVPLAGANVVGLGNKILDWAKLPVQSMSIPEFWSPGGGVEDLPFGMDKFLESMQQPVQDVRSMLGSSIAPILPQYAPKPGDQKAPEQPASPESKQQEQQEQQQDPQQPQSEETVPPVEEEKDDPKAPLPDDGIYPWEEGHVYRPPQHPEGNTVFGQFAPSTGMSGVLGPGGWTPSFSQGETIESITGGATTSDPRGSSIAPDPLPPTKDESGGF